jgi:hypothetical protein
MQILVQSAHSVPLFLESWKPGPSPDEEFEDHISSLDIPVVNGQPSLLLHNLGSDLDPERTARFREIFSFAYDT